MVWCGVVWPSVVRCVMFLAIAWCGGVVVWFGVEWYGKPILWQHFDNISKSVSCDQTLTGSPAIPWSPSFPCSP